MIPISQKTVLAVPLFGIIAASSIRVEGFAPTFRADGIKTRLELAPIYQDVSAVHTISSSSPPSATSQIHRKILGRAEESTFVDSKLDFSLSSAVSTTALLAVRSPENEIQAMGTNKRNFFASLDTMETLNGATKERSALLAKMIDEKKVVVVGEKSSDQSTSPPSIVPTISYDKPGSTETFLASSVAEGKWKVVYAPHMTTAMNIFRGRFDVTYDLFSDSRIVSHAYYDFPIVGKGYLSVSGTYGSVANDASDTYSRVDFEKAWIKALSSSESTATASPYESLEAVPDSFLKTVINEIGKRAFIESVAVFPVSFLDDDTIVFEFEFLGTKICAHKV